MTLGVAPVIGAKRVNAADYGGEVVIERYGHWTGGEHPAWAVPAWGEWGYGDLAGPFHSVAAARAALAAG